MQGVKNEPGELLTGLCKVSDRTNTYVTKVMSKRKEEH